jgi:uncharacterized membrane protein HdeD (DUF308 family)
MCRRNLLIGCAIAAFGLGLLTSCFIESVFWCVFFGVILAAAGIFLVQKK